MQITLAALTAVTMTSCGAGEHCGAGSTCACPPDACADLRTSSADDGKTFHLAVGQWASVELRDQSVDATASTSEPSVMKLVGKTKKEFVNYAKVYASFEAVKPGSARLRFGYVECPGGTVEPCSYSINVDVVRFPKTDVVVTNVYVQTMISLRVGEAARVKAAYGGGPCSVTIDSPEVIRLAVEPICLSNSELETAVSAIAPGSAHLQGCGVTTSATQCSNPWRLTFVVT